MFSIMEELFKPDLVKLYCSSLGRAGENDRFTLGHFLRGHRAVHPGTVDACSARISAVPVRKDPPQPFAQGCLVIGTFCFVNMFCSKREVESNMLLKSSI